jgi:hypothetical protein
MKEMVWRRILQLNQHGLQLEDVRMRAKATLLFSFGVFATGGLLLWHSPGRAETLVVQAKSFIASVNLLDPAQFDADAHSCEAAMAAVVNCGTLNENPADGTKASKNYRLWSELTIEVTCAANRIATWQLKPVQDDFGSEFIIFSTAGDLSKPLSGSPSNSGTMPVDKVTFSYRLRGRPNVAGNAAMEAVKHRTCTYIWHEVAGTLACQQGQPQVAASLRGSQFPSHRLWVRGTKVAEVPQGPFKDLWICDPADPASVK